MQLGFLKQWQSWKQWTDQNPLLRRTSGDESAILSADQGAWLPLPALGKGARGWRKDHRAPPERQAPAVRAFLGQGRKMIVPSPTSSPPTEQRIKPFPTLSPSHGGECRAPGFAPGSAGILLVLTYFLKTGSGNDGGLLNCCTTLRAAEHGQGDCECAQRSLSAQIHQHRIFPIFNILHKDPA